MKLIILATLLIGILSTTVYAQEQDEEKIKHHHLVVTIAHSRLFIQEDAISGNNSLLIPTWGFNYEYLFTKKIGLGLKNDLEIAEYAIFNNEGVEVERENPFSSSIIFLYNPIEGLGFFIGPGIEFEREENFYIFNIGVSYEVEFGKYWDLAPEFSYESKGGHTGAISLGLSVGKRFGK